MKKLILIDGNALVHRAFHALPPMTAPNGLITNAVYGFSSVLIKTIKELKPDYMAAAFDLAGPTFRHEEFEEYKAHRVKAPDELYAQIPLVKKVLEAFGVPIFEQVGFEADDLIGSVAEQAKKEKDLQTVILTGDLDTLQLVEDDKVLVFTLRKGVTDTVLYNEKMVQERYGLRPDQVVDFKGLKGDPSDNIPGVPGIGDKTASALLQEYQTIENLYRELKKKKNFSKGEVLTVKLADKLKTHEDQALFSKRLATIIREVEIEFSLAKIDWRQRLQRLEIEKLFKDFGFFSLVKRLAEIGVGEAEDGSKDKAVATLPLSFPDRPKASGDIYLINPDDPRLFDQAVMGDKKLTIVGHDLKPLLKLAIAKGIKIRARLFDTAIASYILHSDRKDYSWERVVYAHLGKSLDLEPATLQKLREELNEKMKSQEGALKVFEKIEMPLIPILAEMESNGIKVEVEALEKLSRQVESEIKSAEKKIYKLSGLEFNLNSPQQLSEVLFDKLDLKTKVRKTGGGVPSTAASELEKMRAEHPIIEFILQYRELQKVKTTYIDPFPSLISPADGRLHTTYNQTGTVTGRLSSQDPNLQNIPVRSEVGQKFRRAFVAEASHELWSFDYSQLELRIMAFFSQDAKMLEAFRQGEDIHTRTAAEVFEVKPEEVTLEQRREAKALNFGLIYGMGVSGFARSAGVDQLRAREFVTKYKNRFSGLAAYLDQCREEAKKNGYVQTWFGRRRELPELYSGLPFLVAQAERMAVNAPAQGTEADIVKLAMIKIDQYLEEEKLSKQILVLLQVHDELVLEVKNEVKRSTVKKIKEIMEGVWPVEMPLVVDIKKGENWADMEPIKL